MQTPVCLNQYLKMIKNLNRKIKKFKIIINNIRGVEGKSSSIIIIIVIFSESIRVKTVNLPDKKLRWKNN